MTKMKFWKKHTFSFGEKSNPESRIHGGKDKKTFSFGVPYKKEKVLEKNIESLKNNLRWTAIELIFHKHPELEQIGTREDYAEYLKTIFPDSICTDIVYHGVKSWENFDKFEYKPSVDPRIKDHNCFFFTTSYKDARSWGTGDKNRFDYVLPVILNIKKENVGLLEIRGRTDRTYRERGVRKDWELIRDLTNNMGYPGNITTKEVNILKNKWIDSIVVNDHWGLGMLEEYEKRFIVFNPDDIHILGSKDDIQMFKEFVQKKKWKS